MLKQHIASLMQHKWLTLLGVFLCCFGLFIGGSLVSYNPLDPSLNRVVDGEITNWMGEAGAYIADPVLQLLGLAAVLLCFIPCCWGILLLTQSRLPLWWLNIAMLALAIPSIAGMLALLDTSEQWPFQTYGGIMGSFVMEDISFYTSPVTFTVLAVGIGGVSLVFASGFSLNQWNRAVSGVVFVARSCKRFIIFTIAGCIIACKWGIRKIKREELPKEEAPSVSDHYQKLVEYTEKPIVQRKRKPVEKQAKLKLLPEDDFELPALSMLKAEPSKKKSQQLTESSLSQNARMLEKVLQDFGIQGDIIKIRPGPVVTLYELEPAAGIKSSRIIGLSDDIARSMSAVSVRIAVVPGRNVIGIEMPNNQRDTVFLRGIFEDDSYKKESIALPLALGRNIGGESEVVDLAKMPHLLVAGTTGSGKSVAINAMILSLLYRLSPEECKFILIDPKMLELSVYDDIPHLLSPVVTEPGKAVVALKWAVREMENRYRLMSHLGVRNVNGYNDRIKEALQKGEVLERSVQTGFEPETGKPVIEKVALEMKKLPYIVIIVDEMADLMLTAGKDIEGSIQRLAQMARAAGIHLIMATQRPSVDVITGVIKANFPTRISFQVTSRIDSRTILGEQGAEQLLGMGDMLYMSGGTKVTRIHGPFVSDGEVEKVVSYLKTQGEPSYVEDVTTDLDDAEGEGSFGTGGEGADSLYDQAVSIVYRDKKASTSYIQRQLKIGYNRAANIIEQMEKDGIVSQPGHTGRREVLVD